MAAPLLSSFSWSACFPDAARREAAAGAVFDAELFGAALRRFAECGARHAEALRGKGDRESLAQRHYDRLFKVHVSLAHLQGRCKCGTLVKADVSHSEATLDDATCDKMRLEMENIFLHNSSEVYLSLYAALVAELDLVAAIAPLLPPPSSFPAPPRRSPPASPRSSDPLSSSSSKVPRTTPGALSLQHTSLRNMLFVINELLRVEPVCGESCREMIILVCRGMYASRAMRPSRTAGSTFDSDGQVKTLWKNFGSWDELERALRSPSTLDGDAVHMAHSFLLKRFLALQTQSPNATAWSAELLSPGCTELSNRWLHEALLGAPKTTESTLMLAISRLPLKELGAMSPEAVQSAIFRPIQEALELYAESSAHVRLAMALCKILVDASRIHGVLLPKAVSIITQCPVTFRALCMTQLAHVPWDQAAQEDCEDLVGSLLQLSSERDDDMSATHYAELPQLQRAPFRARFITHLVSLQESLVVKGMAPNFNGSPIQESDVFAPLSALAGLCSRFAKDSILAKLIVEEILHVALFRATHVVPSVTENLVQQLEHKALATFAAVASKVSVSYLGSSLVELCAVNFAYIAAESIAMVMMNPVFADWVPLPADMDKLAFLTNHRQFDSGAVTSGPELMDLYIEKLFLGSPNVDLPAEIRGLATRNGGQLIMGVYWNNGPYLRQICAAFLLLSSRYVGMPSAWVLSTLLSEKMSIFSDSVGSISESDLAAAERVLHIKCPNPLIELEWRVLKMLIALHLTLLNGQEVQSFSGSGTFAKYNVAWLASLGAVEKLKLIVSEVDPFVAARLVGRFAQVVIESRRNVSPEGAMAIERDAFTDGNVAFNALFKGLLDRPDAFAAAKQWIFVPLISRGVAAGDDTGEGVGSLLATTLQFFADALWPLAEKQSKLAVSVLDNILHSTYVADSVSNTPLGQSFCWPRVGAGLSAVKLTELAASFARAGSVFLAVCTVQSIQHASLALESAIDLALNVIHEKDLALVCWEAVIGTISADEASIPDKTLEQAAASCALFEKAFPLGNAARKAYSVIGDSLRRHGKLPDNSLLADSSLRRYLWKSFPAPFKVVVSAAGGLDQRSVLKSSSAASSESLPSTPVSGNSRPSSPRRNPSSPRGVIVPALQLASQGAESSRLPASIVYRKLLHASQLELTRAVVGFCSDATHEVCSVLSEIEALEKEFIRVCRSMYETVTRHIDVACGPGCTGAAHITYQTTIQTAESLSQPTENRRRFLQASGRMWECTAKLAAGAFVLLHASSPSQESDACEVLLKVVDFSAEKLFPDSEPLERAAHTLLRACQGPSIELSQSLLESFFRGCRSRFVLEEGTSFFAVEMQDNAFSRTNFLASLLVKPTEWIDSKDGVMALLRVLKMAFRNIDAISTPEFRRLLHLLRLEESLHAVMAHDECMELILELSCRMLSLSDFSASFMNGLVRRSVVDAVNVVVTATECWAEAKPKPMTFGKWTVNLLPIHLPPGAPVWKFDALSVASGKSLTKNETSQVLQLLTRALSLRRKPAGMLSTVRKWLPEMLDCSPWGDLEIVLRSCAVAGEDPLSETVQVICQCAPSHDAVFEAWLSWVSHQVCNLLQNKAAVFRVLDRMAVRLEEGPWPASPHLHLFLKEMAKTSSTSLRRQALFQSLDLFGVMASGFKLRGTHIFPAVLVACERVLWNAEYLPDALKLVQEHCDFASINDADVQQAQLNPDTLGLFVLSLPSSGVISWDKPIQILEAVRRQLVEHCTSQEALMFWIQCCKFDPCVPILLRVLVPLCRKCGTEEACATLFSASVGPTADTAALTPVLRTFVSSLADENLCLTVLHVLPTVIKNPLQSSPLLEALLHSYLSIAGGDAPLEAAALQYTPPSLPSGSRHEFPIHEVAACQSSGGLALTLMLILERQRIVSANDDPAAWMDSFACPALASLHSFQADPTRPFDLVGLWCWAIQAVVTRYRPKVHADLSRVIIDFIQVLDDIFSGYSTPLPVFMRDRMQLAAGVCACLAVQQSVKGVKGDEQLLINAGVMDRRDQVVARAKKLSGCEEFTKVIERIPKVSLGEVSRAFYEHLFPMAAYLSAIVKDAPSIPSSPPSRTSSATLSGSVYDAEGEDGKAAKEPAAAEPPTAAVAGAGVGVDGQDDEDATAAAQSNAEDSNIQKEETAPSTDQSRSDDGHEQNGSKSSDPAKDASLQEIEGKDLTLSDAAQDAPQQETEHDDAETLDYAHEESEKVDANTQESNEK